MKEYNFLDDITYVFLMGFVSLTFPLSVPIILINEYPLERKEDSFFYPPWKRRTFLKKQEEIRKQEQMDPNKYSYAYLYSQAIKQ